MCRALCAASPVSILWTRLLHECDSCHSLLELKWRVELEWRKPDTHCTIIVSVVAAVCREAERRPEWFMPRLPGQPSLAI